MIARAAAYTWGDWYRDTEEDMWQLYTMIERCVRDNRLNFLDALDYRDFKALCRRGTSAPRPPSGGAPRRGPAEGAAAAPHHSGEDNHASEVSAETMPLTKAAISSGVDD